MSMKTPFLGHFGHDHPQEVHRKEKPVGWADGHHVLMVDESHH